MPIVISSIEEFHALLHTFKRMMCIYATESLTDMTLIPTLSNASEPSLQSSTDNTLVPTEAANSPLEDTEIANLTIEDIWQKVTNTKGSIVTLKMRLDMAIGNIKAKMYSATRRDAQKWFVIHNSVFQKLSWEERSQWAKLCVILQVTQAGEKLRVGNWAEHTTPRKINKSVEEWVMTTTATPTPESSQVEIANMEHWANQILTSAPAACGEESSKWVGKGGPCTPQITRNTVMGNNKFDGIPKTPEPETLDKFGLIIPKTPDPDGDTYAVYVQNHTPLRPFMRAPPVVNPYSEDAWDPDNSPRVIQRIRWSAREKKEEENRWIHEEGGRCFDRECEVCRLDYGYDGGSSEGDSWVGHGGGFDGVRERFGEVFVGGYGEWDLDEEEQEEAQAEVQSEAQTEVQSEAQTEVQSEAQTEVQSAQAEVQSGAQSGVQSQVQSEMSPSAVEQGAQQEVEQAVQKEAQQKTQPEFQSDAQSQSMTTTEQQDSASQTTATTEPQGEAPAASQNIDIIGHITRCFTWGAYEPVSAQHTAQRMMELGI